LLVYCNNYNNLEFLTYINKQKIIMKHKNYYLIISVAMIFSFSLFSCDPTNPEVAEASSIELSAGGSQSGIITKHLENNIEVTVKDQNGNPILNTSVKFEVEKGLIGGSHSGSTTTDTNGKISLRWTLGPDEGNQTLTITAFKADGTTPLTNSPLSITANASIPANVTDIDGNTYEVVKIGTKVWMAENLKVTKYSDGTAIPEVVFSDDWAALNDNNIDKAYRIYNNVTHDICYYTLAAATNGAEPNTHTDTRQCICPDGWHLPTGQEWDQLVDTLGGTLIAGGKLKEDGTSHWWTGGNTGTNESGFTALPSGYRSNTDGNYMNPTNSAYWWSYTSSLSEYADIYAVVNNSNEVFNTQIKKSSGAGVRCVMDYDVYY